MRLKKGILVVIEGIDGAGKTTQAAKLHGYLTGRGLDVVLTKEPTDGIYGQKIRKLAQGDRHRVTPRQEYDLFINDRKQHVADLIQPALNGRKIVILDRYYFSTIAYQGAIGVDDAKIKSDNEAFSPVPDVVFLLEVPPRHGIQRIQNGRKEIPNTFEKEDYLEKVARIFDRLTDHCIVRLDGCDGPDTVHSGIVKHMDALIERHCLPDPSPAR